MTIVLNGKEHALEPGATVRDLLQALGRDRDGIAVAVDLRVVPRSAHASTVLATGARVDVIQAVGGG